MSDSIKVAIRVRPLIKREKDDNLSIQWITQGNTIVATDTELKKRADGGFEFDHIFDTNASNNDVFDNVVKPIVDAAVNGFNGTVFAYGQTSSGKTYTMMGTSGEPGVIHIAVEHMFDAIANTPGREFLLRVSYLEIYNEEVNDLLSEDLLDLKIHEDSNGQVFVKCEEEVTNCLENVLSIMNKGNKKIRISETTMNERSSRSHTIFRITIESREANADSDGAIQVSQLNMVDLAGSERAHQTGATKEHFKEGCHIDLSLSTLALVIKQLSEDHSQKYINHRDSKLTRLLQPSLGGNAMTVILCAVTPAVLDETQCTLSFASRAKNIKNKPELNEVMSDGVLLKRYVKQIQRLNVEFERTKQLAQTIDFQEMESKIQEKDRVNQALKERIRLLQTQIVTADNNNNAVPLKTKEKRRRTWCGGGFNKASTSTSQMCTNFSSPIKKMSPISSRHEPADLIDSSFQIEYTDFELKLMNREDSQHYENDSDEEDSFVTVTGSLNYSEDSTTFEKCDVSIQTSSYQSPSTPEEYVSEHEKILARISQLEKQLKNVTSDKDAFEHTASELRKNLTAAESRYTLAEEQLNEQKAELQRIPDLEKKIAQFSAQTQEKQAQEAIKNKEAEFQMRLKSEKDAYNKRIEDLTCTIDSFKTKNMELTNNIEGLEANQKQLKNIIELKNNELTKNNQIMQKTHMDMNHLTKAYNDLNKELEEKELYIAKLDELLKIKCDELTECKANLETIVPENNLLKQQISEQKAIIEKYKIEIEIRKMETRKEIDAIKDEMIYMKCQLNQKNKEIENYISEIDLMTQRNEVRKLQSGKVKQILREYEAKKNRLEAEAAKLQEKIKALEKNQNQFSTVFDRVEKSHDEECSCTTLINKIRELQLKVASRNKKIDALELQICSGSFPYQTKCKELQEHLSVYSNKNSELKAEIERLQMAMLRTSAKECDVCKTGVICRRHRSCQTMPDNVL